jgi:5-methylcytosine-specific restriction endonuclease McrA
MIKINKKEKDKLRNRLYKRDGKECYYCGIKEEDFIPIWGKFYGGNRGQKLEVDRRDNQEGYTFLRLVNSLYRF